MSGFLDALKVTLAFEGGFTHDTGGDTYQGITQAVYDKYRDQHGQARQPVKQMPEDERDHIYYSRYWLAAHCEALPWPVSMAHFDCAVNAGVARAIKILQASVTAAVDGVWGDETKERVQLSMHDPEGLLERMFWNRAEFYYVLASQENKTYGPYFLGWMKRIIQLRKKVWAAW